MKPNNLKETVKAMIRQFYNEGLYEWSQKDVHASINPKGYKNELLDFEIQEMFKELEQEGYIKFIGENERYWAVRDRKHWKA